MFDPKTPTEKESFAFDYDGLLATGETISTAQVLISVLNGEDPSPQDMVEGAPTVDGSKVHILIGGGIEGNIYSILCKATTSTGQILDLCGDLKVQAC